MNNVFVILNSQRVLLDIKRKKMVIMKRVDCERGCASFFSFIPPVLCDNRLQVLWGNWLPNQTFPNFEHFDGVAQLWGGQ